MAQDLIDEVQESESDLVDSPLVICKGCGKLVPKTNHCLYCGTPILFKRNVST